MPLYLPSFDEIMTVAETRGEDSDAPHLWRGLVGSWPLQEPAGVTAFDVSGWGRNGTITGTRSVGQKGRSVTLATTNNVNMGDVSSLDGATALTVSLWLKPSSVANNERFVSKWVGPGEFTFIFCTQDTSRPAFAVNGGGGTSNNFGKKTTDANLVIGAWVHLAATWKPGTIQLFVDGRERAQTNWLNNTVNTLNVTTASLRIGDSVDVNGVDGEYALLAIYPRILTPAEIAQLYADPWAMYRLRTAVFPAAVAAGGDSTIQLPTLALYI